MFKPQFQAVPGPTVISFSTNGIEMLALPVGLSPFFCGLDLPIGYVVGSVQFYVVDSVGTVLTGQFRSRSATPIGTSPASAGDGSEQTLSITLGSPFTILGGSSFNTYELEIQAVVSSGAGNAGIFGANILPP